jgi:large subunit ribosomal protein L9
MKIILRENVEHLGKMGDLVDVKDGYARNFLIPKNLAYVATVHNIKTLEHQKRLIGDKLKKERKEAEEFAQKLSSLSVTLTAQVGEEGKLFGSVTSKDIAEALSAQGFTIDRKQIELEKPIKELGDFTIPVKVKHDVKTEVKVSVTKAD